MTPGWLGTRDVATYTGRHNQTVLHAVQEYQRTGVSGLEGYQPTRRGKWFISREAADRWMRGEPPVKKSSNKRALRAV